MFDTIRLRFGEISLSTTSSAESTLPLNGVYSKLGLNINYMELVNTNGEKEMKPITVDYFH